MTMAWIGINGKRSDKESVMKVKKKVQAANGRTKMMKNINARKENIQMVMDQEVEMGMAMALALVVEVANAQ